MAEVSLERIVFTNISYDLDVEDAEEFYLEVKNEITLRLPKDTNDNSFLLAIETTVFDKEQKYLRIIMKTNSFFNCDEKLSSYDNDIIENDCFPLVFKIIMEKIDQILEILDYPKINLSSDKFRRKSE